MSGAVRRAYRPEIDGLRAVSILCVLLYHLDFQLLNGGFIGVDVFFVISGYLITRIILSESQRGGFSFARFYERRARRILPALIAMLLFVCLGALFLATPYDMKKFAQHILYAALQVSNFHFSEKVSYFEIESTPSPLLHTWSLGVEEQFYLFWPLAIVVLAGPRGPLSALGLFLVVIGVSFAINVVTLEFAERFAFYHLPSRAWQLALGGVLAVGSVSDRLRAALSAREWLREALAGLGLALIVGAALLISRGTPYPGAVALAPTCGAALIIAATATGRSLVGAALSWSPVVALGVISYSLYLWHWPLVIFAKNYFAIGQLTTAMGLAIGAASVAIAALSWRYVEQPFRSDRGGQGGARSVLVGSLSAIAVVAVMSFGLSAARDAEWRFDASRVAPTSSFAPLQLGPNCLRNPEEIPNLQVFTDQCTFGPSAPGFDVLVFGDSHAKHYFDGVAAWARSEGLTARMVGVVGCPPFFADYRYFAHGRERTRCREISDAVERMALRDGDVKFVFLGLRFSTYFRGDDRFANQYLTDGQSSMRSRAESESAIARSIVETLRRIKRAGATPVVLGEVPRLARHPKNCEALKGALLRQWIPLPDAEACGAFNKAYNEGLKARSDAILRRAVALGGGVYFDPEPHISGRSPQGDFYYLDENHLTGAGSLHLGAKLDAAIGAGR